MRIRRATTGRPPLTPRAPALTVTSGTVVVTGVTFFTTGDAPTILVTGGTLVLGDDIIQQSSDLADDPPLIEVTGGTVDLTTLGGNTLTVAQGAPLHVVGDGLAAQVSSQNVLSLTDLGGAYIGNSFPATASATADGSISLNYYDIFGDQLSGAPVYPGTYTVVASFASNDPNFPNVSSQVTFSITQATPALTLSAPGSTYDGQPFAATATVAGVVAGVDNSAGASLESVPITLSYYTASGTPLNGPPVDAGTYTVVASFAGSYDYTAASKSATYTIAPAPLTVTVNSVSAIYGQPIPTLSGTVSGIENGDPITATYATLATPTSSVGSYPIAVTLSDGGTGKLADYAVTVIPGTVTITQPAPGVSLVGSTLYIYGAMNGHSGDSIQISPSGSGVLVNASISGVHTTQTYHQPIAAIYVYGFNNTQSIQLAAGLTIPAFIYEGNGNGDSIQLGNANNVVSLGNGNGNSVQGGNGNNVVTVGNGNGDSVQLGNGNNIVTAGNGNGDSVQLGNGNNVVTVGNGNGDSVQVGNGNNIVTAGNGNGDSITAGNGDNLLIAGLGQHSVQAGNGSNILIDGSVTLQGSATLSQVLDEWVLDGASAASLIRSQLSVTDNSSHTNTLSAGRGLDWFWATYGKDKINRKVGDLLN